MTNMEPQTREEHAMHLMGLVARKRLVLIRVYMAVAILLIIGPTIYSSVASPLHPVIKVPLAVIGFVLLYIAILWRSHLAEVVQNGELRRSAHVVLDSDKEEL